MAGEENTRVKIDAPQKVHYVTDYRISIGDINYGNHLANDAVLRIAHEIRLRFLESEGWTEMDVAGAQLIMADAAIQFKRQAHRGDVLQCEVTVTAISKMGFTLVTRFVDQKTKEDVAILRNGMVFFDYAKGKVMLAPEAFKSRFTFE